ncbi:MULTISPECIES: DNA integrity scanning diadenylate cyclase DisA [Atopobiaceae]|uniref:Diadenylate cyclase n=1 Tax=Parafannyhessea umbonata TaxID=604330 RepID=A0A1H9PQV0_9ACTN|nr:diadenylate cyclase [Parafannyhessea umbonata]SER50185.1 diadenylate cyclase [Parafannyhessea umbonata]SJZ72612.1 diadenylate cyclase [Olsenella sp. KH1P3]
MEGTERAFEASEPVQDFKERMRSAIRQTAPGTSLRHALDMIIAGHLGALICIGDTDAVLATGDDGFCLDISFTANRLFELSKMDGAIVVDKGLTQILRANYHLNPDPSLPTSETGMRHRTAARMSLLTNAMVISVSERRQVVTVYIDGRGHSLRSVSEIMSSVNQLLVSLQSTRTQLDRALLRLTTLELDNYVTLSDITETIYLFEVLMTAADELDNLILELGTKGKTIAMQREEFIGDMSDVYTLLIRDYANDSSEENALAIRATLHETANDKLRSSKRVGALLGFDEHNEDSIMHSLGLRTLSNVSVVRKGMADKIVDEYGSLQQLLDDIEQNPARLDRVGVENPSILADSLYRMWGKRA